MIAFAPCIPRFGRDSPSWSSPNSSYPRLPPRTGCPENTQPQKTRAPSSSRWPGTWTTASRRSGSPSSRSEWARRTGVVIEISRDVWPSWPRRSAKGITSWSHVSKTLWSQVIESRSSRHDDAYPTEDEGCDPQGCDQIREEAGDGSRDYGGGEGRVGHEGQERQGRAQGGQGRG